MVRPVLGELDLQQVQRIVMDDAEVFTAHAPAALDAQFLQRLAHRSASIRLLGVLSGADARTGLADLRQRFRDAEPLSFTADVATAARIDQVLVEELTVREVAGHPDRFEYAITLRHYSPPPTPQTETPAAPPPAPPPPMPDAEQATLVVQVSAPGRPGLDPGTVTVTAATSDGAQRRELGTRQGSSWTETPLSPATWTVTATAPGGLTGTATATTQGGQTAQAMVALSAGPAVALAEVVSFRFDRAFVEPGQRPVLRQAVTRAASGSQHLLVLGHTDKTGSDAANLSLSQRRVDAVLAYLTAGNDPAAARQVWLGLRDSDSWGLREAQHMLQALGRYPGAIDGQDGPLTQDAVQATRCAAGLAPGTLDDDAWSALIAGYLRQDAFTLDESILVKDAAGTVVRGFACGESHPLPLPKPTVATAHRQYRRVELIFTPDGQLPAAATPADAVTWDMAAVGPAQIPVVSAEPALITVQGTITRLTRSADGTVKEASAANQHFVLITSDGEFKQGEQSTGEPLEAHADAQGAFSFTGLRAGWYTLEVRMPNGAAVLARLHADPDDAARGPSVTAHLITGQDRLDVVLLPDAPRRQLRLPVVAHLLTILNADTQQLREAAVLGSTIAQRTVRTKADVEAALAVANRIWAPARIAFDLAHVATEAVRHRDKPEGAVDDDEAARIVLGGGYPDVLNVFLIAVAQSGEAGLYEKVQVKDPATQVVESSADGIVTADRPLRELFIGSPPVPADQSDIGRAVALAHEFGHALTLDHTTGSARPHALMDPFIQDDHQQLDPAEATRARASDNAGDCRPLRLQITGAQQIGGTGPVSSGQFAAAPDPAGVVTLQAQIADVQLAGGSLTWRGGTAAADPLQRTVPRAGAREERVEVTFTPAAGRAPVTTFARILVTSFTLGVTGATRAGGPAGTTFLARIDAKAAPVAVDAALDRAPETVSSDLVTWAGGDAVTDPLRRIVPRDRARREQITATLAGQVRTVTVVVFDLALVTGQAPFAAPVADVLIEGLSNEILGKITLAAVSHLQQISLFRARALIPGAQQDTVSATITSAAKDGSLIETTPLTLTRRAPGSDVFLSVPLLAFPRVIPRSDLTFPAARDLELIRAASGGTMTLRVDGMFASESVKAGVHSRVTYLDVQIFTGSGVAVADVRDQHVPNAQRAWAQAGIEVLLRRPVREVAPPDGSLLEVDHTDNHGLNLTDEELQLVGAKGRPPQLSVIASDLNVLYVKSIGPPGGPDGKGTVGGIAFPRYPVILVTSAVTGTALGHEVGHKLHQEHTEDGTADGKLWPERVIMYKDDTGKQRDVPPAMVEAVVRGEIAQRQLEAKGQLPPNPPMRHVVREP
jgi:outer membrane protein OmpA-like peptidoglycan-associated protein